MSDPREAGSKGTATETTEVDDTKVMKSSPETSLKQSTEYITEDKVTAATDQIEVMLEDVKTEVQTEKSKGKEADAIESLNEGSDKNSNNTTSSLTAEGKSNNRGLINLSPRLHHEHQEVTRKTCTLGICPCLSEHQKCCLSLMIRLLASMSLATAVYSTPSEYRRSVKHVDEVRRGIIVIWCALSLIVIPSIVRIVGYCREGSPATIGRPRPNLLGKAKIIQQVFIMTLKPYRYIVRQAKKVTVPQKYSGNVYKCFYGTILFISPLVVGLGYTVPKDTYYFMTSAGLLSFVSFFEGEFLSTTLVCHYMLVYIGNIYILDGVLFVTTVNYAYFLEMYTNATTLEDLSSSPVLEECVIQDMTDDGFSIHDSVIDCITNYQTAYNRYLIDAAALTVYFRLFVTAAIVNMFPGRSLNWDTRAISNIWSKLECTILVLVLVCSVSFELAFNSVVLVRCNPADARNLWVTSLFRIIKDMFVDMNVTVKAWKRIRGSTAHSNAFAIAILVILYISLTTVGFLIMLDSFDHRVPMIPEPTAPELCEGVEAEKIFPSIYPALLAVSQICYMTDRLLFNLKIADVTFTGPQENTGIISSTSKDRKLWPKNGDYSNQSLKTENYGKKTETIENRQAV